VTWLGFVHQRLLIRWFSFHFRFCVYRPFATGTGGNAHREKKKW
jgi:hypothetical protein